MKTRPTKRSIEVRIRFDLPGELASLVKDVTLSFHSQEIAGDSRAVQVPWTDAVRLVGSESVFTVRMKVPAGLPCLLHALTLIDEPGNSRRGLVVRRHIGFANMLLASDQDHALLSVDHFQGYALVTPSDPHRAAA